MKYPIATKSATGRSKPLTAELLVNMYAEQAPDGARNQVAAIGCPGLSVFSDISSDYIRGVHWSASDSTLWVVAGLTLYKVTSAGVASSIGTVGGYGRVGMADNGIEIVITSSAIAYTVTLATNTLAPITDNDYPNSYTVAFLDGYFLFANNQTGSRGQFFISGLYDGDAYDALDFATAENAADNLVRVWRDHDRVLLFGDDTTETWFNSGDADFPFAPYKGSTLNRGLGARWSVANVDNRVIFLDDNGIVRVADEAGTRISTHAIEYQISQGSWRHDDAASYDGAFASTYVEEGHEFYCLTVPNTGTFVFDAATGLWHTRKSRGLETSRTSFHVKAFNKIICGDIETGKLYEQSLSYYDEAGEYLMAEIQFPQLVNDNRRFTVHQLQLNMESGYFDPNDYPSSSGSGESIFEDEYFPYVTSLMHFDGVDGSDVFTDEISDNVWSVAAGAPEISTDQSKFGGASGYFNGSSYISCPSSPRFGFLDETFTVEGWVRFDELNNRYYMAFVLADGTSPQIFVRADGFNDQLTIYVFGGEFFSGAGSISVDTWYHIAISGEPGDYKIFIDGQKVQDGVGSTNAKATASAYFGGAISSIVSASNIHIGYVDEWRVTKGVARYDSNFTVPINAYPETNQINLGYSEPFVTLDVSSDTRTFDITQPLRSLGKQGEYKKRIIWRRLGQHRTFTPRFTISAPVKRIVFDATIELTPNG